MENKLKNAGEGNNLYRTQKFQKPNMMYNLSLYRKSYKKTEFKN